MSTLFDLLALFFLCWLAAWRLLGDRHGWLALVNAWAWWLFSAAIPMGTVALWRRSRLAGLAWAIAGAVLWQGENGWTLLASVQQNAPLPNRPRSTISTSGNLSLLTFNLLNRERKMTPLLQLIERKIPDILLFQECIPSHAAQLEAGLSHHYPHRLWLPAPEYGMGFGIASRHPFALTGFWQYPGFEPFATRITFALQHPSIPAPLLDIYCVQFISPTNEVRRVGLTALLRLRERQIDWVLAEIARRKAAAVVAGDWNTTEGSDAYGRAAGQLVDGWREAGNGPGWNWPRRLNPYRDSLSLPVLRLDYAMHTGNRFPPALAVTKIQVLRVAARNPVC